MGVIEEGRGQGREEEGEWDEISWRNDFTVISTQDSLREDGCTDVQWLRQMTQTL